MSEDEVVIDWVAVKATVAAAEAMHFDGCHKIYLSLDRTQEVEMISRGYASEAPDFEKLRLWFTQSCFLRFVNAMKTVAGADGIGEDTEYVTVIPQGAIDPEEQDV